MTDEQQRAYNVIINTMIIGKKYQVTDEQIETIKLIWDTLHDDGYWFSLNSNTLVKFEI